MWTSRTTHDHPQPPMAIPPLIITTLILTTKETQVVFVQRSEEMVVTCKALRVSGFKHSPHHRIFPPASRSGSPISWSRIRIYSSSNHRIYRRDVYFLFDFNTNYQPQLVFLRSKKVYHHWSEWVSILSILGFPTAKPSWQAARGSTRSSLIRTLSKYQLSDIWFRFS